MRDALLAAVFSFSPIGPGDGNQRDAEEEGRAGEKHDGAARFAREQRGPERRQAEAGGAAGDSREQGGAETGIRGDA